MSTDGPTVKRDIEELNALKKKEENLTQRRLDLCKVCDKLLFKDSLKICSQCGCCMWVKARLYKAECPIGKW